MSESERPQYTWMSLLIRCIYGIFLIMFIVQGIIGCVYIHDCPVQPSIPFFMIMCGFISFFWALSWCKNGCRIFCYCLIATLCIVWFSVSSIFIYSIYEPDYDKNTKETDRYCNKTLYLSAFWCMTLTYILAVVHVFCFLSAACNNRMDPFELHNDEDRPLLWS